MRTAIIIACGFPWIGENHTVAAPTVLYGLVLLLYLSGIAAAFRSPWLAQLLYVLVALLWFVPDRRIENVLVR